MCIPINFTTLSIIILISILFYLLNNLLNNKFVTENFEDYTNNPNDFEEDFYDNEFVDLYEIIYRDFEDINYDYTVISNKILSKIKNKDSQQPKILVAGSGVGKLCKKLKDENYSEIVGIEKSKNMFLKAKHLYPNIKFIHGDLADTNIFKENDFDIIIFDERALYYNTPEKQNLIIQNSHKWLNNKGFLIVPIYDNTKLQVAARYYSSNYFDNKGNRHGLTYLNNFSHDCYYVNSADASSVLDDNSDKTDSDKSEKSKEKKDETKNETKKTNEYYYYDKILLQDVKENNKRIKKTSFFINNKETIFDMIFNNGFDIFYIEPHRVQIVGGYELVLFRKK